MDQYLDLLNATDPYRAILVANALTSSVLYPYLLYLFFYRSPKEISTSMRLNMLNATTTCYAVVMMLALWQPVAVIPLLAGFSAGPLRLIGDWITIYAYEVTLALILNLIHAYTMAYLLHYSALRPLSKVKMWMGSHRKTILYYIIRTTIVISLMVAFVHYMHNSPEELNEMINNLPPSEFQAFILAVSRHESSFASYSYVKWTKGMGVVYIGLLTSFVAIEVTIITLMIYKTAKEIQMTKKIVRPNTHQAQMMVFRTFLIKSIFFLVFFLMPLLMTLLALVGALHSHWPGYVMHLMFSLHTPLVYLQMLYVMRPYRRFTCALLKRTFSLLRCAKYEETSEHERLDRSSGQMSHTMSSAALITRTGSERVYDRSTKVHPVSSANFLHLGEERRHSLKPLGVH
ncbi:serpentine type 7TM GPCR chemoreceptor srh domain-containing protein [Ditylenchus destructor]|nr:serpentine type 7TM GPCR chemoreceptor srh domain-containing protein [Ditylenchus destructor]